MLYISLKEREEQGNYRLVSLILIPGKYRISYQSSSKVIEGNRETITGQTQVKLTFFLNINRVWLYGWKW